MRKDGENQTERDKEATTSLPKWQTQARKAKTAHTKQHHTKQETTWDHNKRHSHKSTAHERAVTALSLRDILVLARLTHSKVVVVAHRPAQAELLLLAEAALILVARAARHAPIRAVGRDRAVHLLVLLPLVRVRVHVLLLVLLLVRVACMGVEEVRIAAGVEVVRLCAVGVVVRVAVHVDHVVVVVLLLLH